MSEEKHSLICEHVRTACKMIDERIKRVELNQKALINAGKDFVITGETTFLIHLKEQLTMDGSIDE